MGVGPSNPPQTEHARGLKFCMVSPHGSLLRVTEAIFYKSPLSRDIGVGFSDFPNFFCYNQLNWCLICKKDTFLTPMPFFGWFFHFYSQKKNDHPNFK